MDENSQQALLEQLAEASRQSADALATLGADLVALRAHVEQVDHQLAEMRGVQQAAVERLERLAPEIERLSADRSLSAQIEAMRTTQTAVQSQIEGLEGKTKRLDRTELAMGQLRDEMVKQLEDREQMLRTELKTQAKHQGDQARDLAEGLRALDRRFEDSDVEPRLETVTHRNASLAGELATLKKQVDEQGAHGDGRDEDLRRSSQALETGIAGVDEGLGAIRTRVDQWQERIEEQLETVKHVQVIAREMQDEAKRMRVDNHAAAEAWKVAEGRVDHSLSAMRESIDERLDRLMGERRNEWQAHAEQHRNEVREAREAREAALEESQASVEGLREEISAGLDITGRDIAELKHRLAAYFRTQMSHVQETTEAFDTQLPSDDPTVGDPERRQALRRALRARRAARGG